MKVIIAEKPSLARNIVDSIGAMKKADGYYYNDEYYVTWAFGHLFSLYDIEDYTKIINKPVRYVSRAAIGYRKCSIDILKKYYKV